MKSKVIRPESLVVSVEPSGTVLIEQKRIGGTEAWVSFSQEELKEIVEFVKEIA